MVMSMRTPATFTSDSGVPTLSSNEKFNYIYNQLHKQLAEEESKEESKKVEKEKLILQIINEIKNYILPYEIDDQYLLIDSNASCLQGSKLAYIIIWEIGTPLISGFVGMHTLLFDYFFKSKVLIYVTAGVLSIIDSIVHYALMINVYKQILGIPTILLDATVNGIRRKQLKSIKIILSNILDPEYYNTIAEEEYKKYAELLKLLINYINDSTSEYIKTWWRKLWEILLQILIFTVFVALRISGGYFIVTKFFLAIALPATFATSWVGITILIVVIFSYVLSGILTRKESLHKFIISSAEEQHEQLKNDLSEIKKIFPSQLIEAIIREKEEKKGVSIPKKETTEVSNLSTEGNKEKQELKSLLDELDDVAVILKNQRNKGLINIINRYDKVKDKNTIFSTFKVNEYLEAHRNPRWDKLFGIQHTNSWKKMTDTIRKDAKVKLFDEIQHTLDSSRKKTLLEEAKRMDIFKLHRNNFFFFGAYGRTATVKEIEDKINEINIPR